MNRMCAHSRKWPAVAVTFLVLATLGTLVPSSHAHAAEEAPLVNSADLFEHPELWAGVTVRIEGEAIGSLMVRGEHTWIHVNDDSYARDGSRTGELAGYNGGIPVVLPTTEAEAITTLGEYRRRGDIVSVVGRFESASVEHGGETLLVGQTLTVLEAGGLIETEAPRWRTVIALMLAILVLGIVVLRRGANA